MALSPTLIQRLRYLIHDIATPYTYTDYQLSVYITIGAVQVVSEIAFDTTFVIDTDTPDITPDPLSLSSIGIANLFVLRAACILYRSELRKDASKFGIRIRDHLTQYDGTVGMQARMDGSKSMCQFYEDTKYEWQLGNRAAGRAIVGPYTDADSQAHKYQHSLDWGNDNPSARR